VIVGRRCLDPVVIFSFDHHGGMCVDRKCEALKPPPHGLVDTILLVVASLLLIDSSWTTAPSTGNTHVD
jgi:hypothetical protein